jgi:hypothetical protein
MLSTALNYVALRLLRVDPNGGDGALEKSRKWILDHGGPTFMPSWGKFWLSVGDLHFFAYVTICNYSMPTLFELLP